MFCRYKKVIPNNKEMLQLHSNNDDDGDDDDDDAVSEIRKSFETGTITPDKNLQI